MVERDFLKFGIFLSLTNSCFYSFLFYHKAYED
jgi:hypothetical protein